MGKKSNHYRVYKNCKKQFAINKCLVMAIDSYKLLYNRRLGNMQWLYEHCLINMIWQKKWPTLQNTLTVKPQYTGLPLYQKPLFTGLPSIPVPPLYWKHIFTPPPKKKTPLYPNLLYIWIFSITNMACGPKSNYSYKTDTLSVSQRRKECMVVEGFHCTWTQIFEHSQA